LVPHFAKIAPKKSTAHIGGLVELRSVGFGCSYVVAPEGMVSVLTDAAQMEYCFPPTPVFDVAYAFLREGGLLLNCRRTTSATRDNQ
jgi:DNA-binding transcriptional MocR family regulator